MRIEKMIDGYALNLGDVYILFESFEKGHMSVTLCRGVEAVSVLYFEKATEFYRAWRECHNGL